MISKVMITCTVFLKLQIAFSNIGQKTAASSGFFIIFAVILH